MVTLLAVVASAAAFGFALLAWKQHREAAGRSAARVAALAAAIDGRDPGLGRASVARTRSPPSTPRASGPLFTSETPAPRRWMIAAGVVPVALVVAALLVTRGPRTASPAPALHQPQSLELLAMRHDARRRRADRHRHRARARARRGAGDRRRDRARRRRARRRQCPRPARRRRTRPRRRVVVPGGRPGRPRRAPVSGTIRNAARTAGAHRPARHVQRGSGSAMTCTKDWSHRLSLSRARHRGRARHRRAAGW